MSGRRKLGKMPRKPANIVLGARDQFVCSAIGKARVLTTSDLALLAFPSIAIARRRLRRLHDGGYIAAYVDAYSTENRWTLDKRGLELMGRPGRYAPTQSPTISVHRQILVRLWVLLARACHQAPSATLERFSFEWELSGSSLPTREQYRPDGVLLLRNSKVTYGFMVEVDTGTESLRHLREQKIPKITRLAAGQSSVGNIQVTQVLLVAPNLKRLKALLAIAANEKLPAIGRLIQPSDTELCTTSGWHHASGHVGSLFAGGRTTGLPPDHGPTSQAPRKTPVSGQTRPRNQGQKGLLL